MFGQKRGGGKRGGSRGETNNLCNMCISLVRSQIPSVVKQLLGDNPSPRCCPLPICNPTGIHLGRCPICQSLMWTVLVVEPEPSPDTFNGLNH